MGIEDQIVGKYTLINMDKSTEENAPVISGTNVGSTDTIGTFYYYAISTYSQSVNKTPLPCGASVIGTILKMGTMGTSNRLTWTPFYGAYKYSIFKGTSEADLRELLYVDGTVGTWIDPDVNVDATEHPPYSQNTAYTQSIILPDLRSYSPTFDSNILIHNMANFSKVIYNKGNLFKCELVFEQISDEEMEDLRTVYNWKSNLRFYPKIVRKPELFFDCILTSNWNFTLTVPTFEGGGWSGSFTLVGSKPIQNISEVL